MASGTPNKKNPSKGQSTGSPVPTKPPMVPSLFDEPAERVTGGEEFQARYQSIANVFREAAALPDRRARYSAIKSKLIPLLLQDKATQHDAFQALDDLIRHGLALKGSTPDESGDVTLFADLLTDDTLDEWVREKIAGIVRTREAWWGGDLHPVIEKLAKASNVAIDWMGWRICGKVLTTTEQVEGELIDTLATKWVIEHLFGNEKDPWTWRVYGHILSHSKENDYRIVAVQRLGADGPTSAERPLPADVAEVWKLLDSLADQDEDLDLRREAKAALARLVERAHDEAARKTRISICQIDSRSTVALPPGEWIVHYVEPPRLLISLNLTTFPRPEETSFVARMDATKEVSLGTTAAPPPDLDFSSHQFTTNGGGDGFSPGRSAAATAIHADRLDLASVSFTTTDPAVQSARVLLVSEPAEVLSQLDVLEHGKGLLARIQMRQDAPVVTKSAVQEYLDRLGKTDFGTYAVSAKEDLAQTFTTLIEDSGLRFLCRDSRDGCDKKIVRTEVFVPNDRSHGSFQFSVGGRPITSASWPVMQAVFPNEARQILDRRKSD